MCLGIPAEVKEVRGHVAVVDFGDGVLREVDAGAIEDLKPGDLVIVHAGVIIERLKGREAEELVRNIQEFIEELERRAEELARLYGLPEAGAGAAPVGGGEG
ncbi:MAG: HypC/HybG/HupF family hydrogenase formation chaperone [Crenarchaeota archaeon]|nr:HypC/HybG/HupF family hydrogenase formation chaperone [Thermoproteota archaeon]